MKAILSFLLLYSVITLSAQNLELGFWGGISFYQGDLSAQEIDEGLEFFSETFEPAGGIFVRLNPVRPFSLELGLNLGKIKGKDGITNNFPARDFNFRSRITELALKGNLHLFRLGNAKGTQVAPYLMTGASVFRFNPEREFDGNYIELQPIGTEAQGVLGYDDPYSLTNYAVLFGAGIKVIVKERFTIGLELGTRKTFTDYLDDVSGRSIDYLDVLENNGSLAAQLSNPSPDTPQEGQTSVYTRGGDYEDWYFMGGLSFSFAFGGGTGVNGKGIGCPTF